ncbi:hypothetical protein B0H13DRAFT_1880721 [Mycena leptocephala]|nr:hypothetical protein B0H13DRAFT_1880721 [Mycena leptocephala]
MTSLLNHDAPSSLGETLAKLKEIVGLLRTTLRKGKPSAESTTLQVGEPSSETIREVSKPLPVLPPEIWDTILSFTIRLNGRKSVRLEDPFHPPYTTESSVVEDPGMQQDRTTIPLVSRSWRSIASQIVPEFLRIRSIPQLRAIVERFEETQDGHFCSRIDFQISEQLTASPDLIPRLLRRTPNLMVYINQNDPFLGLEALAKYCGPSLRRIEWSHVGEAPTWRDLANLCHHAPNLTTLRLTWIFSYTQPVREMLELPFLETLSLGLIPDPIDDIAELPISWDPLLNYFASDPEMLPSLRRFEVDIFPTDLRFFAVHGSKIQTFRTTNWSTPPMLPTTLPLLPNLDSLILTQSTEYVTLPHFIPHCAAYPLDSVLLSIDSTKLPRLEEVRLRNIGILMNLVDEPAWLLKWAKRWHFKGVRFCDMRGLSFGDTQDMRCIDER